MGSRGVEDKSSETTPDQLDLAAFDAVVPPLCGDDEHRAPDHQ